MKILGIEHTNREALYLCMVLLILLGFLVSIWAAQQDYKEYKEALAECLDNFELLQSGSYNTWGNPLVNATRFNYSIETVD